MRACTVWIVATFGAILAPSVDVFGYSWLVNSFAYTITWGAVVQVIGAEYDEANKAAQLAFCASASRFGASIGNVAYGQLLSAGFDWRKVCMPMVPIQVLLLAMCFSKWAGSTAAAPAKPTAGTTAADSAPAPSVLGAFLSLDFWLMLVPKMVTFTFTQVRRTQLCDAHRPSHHLVPCQRAMPTRHADAPRQRGMLTSRAHAPCPRAVAVLYELHPAASTRVLRL